MHLATRFMDVFGFVFFKFRFVNFLLLLLFSDFILVYYSEKKHPTLLSTYSISEHQRRQI